MVGVSWVYFRRRYQLIAIATEFGLDTEGTVSISTHAEQDSQRLVELEQQYRGASGSEHSDSKSRSRSVSPVPSDRVVPQVIVTAPGRQPPSGRLLRGNRSHSPATQITCRTVSPYRTIERVEKRAAAHLIDLAHLSQAIPELLTGNASDWFRVSRLQGASWATFKQDFLDFFLPPRNFQRLEDQIRARSRGREKPSRRTSWS
ncbi:hypothetical protein ACLKA7_007773 [Drosophila subpalustris]